MGGLMWIIVIATSIWVLVDAKTIGVKKGQIKGMGDIGPWGWFFVCLLLWIVGFPFYLAKRSEFKRFNSKQSSDPTISEAEVEANLTRREEYLNQRVAALIEKQKIVDSYNPTNTFVTKSGRVFSRGSEVPD